jgi:hypothetical protein
VKRQEAISLAAAFAESSAVASADPVGKLGTEPFAVAKRPVADGDHGADEKQQLHSDDSGLKSTAATWPAAAMARA